MSSALQSLASYACCWADLSAFLLSEAGGSLRIETSADDTNYALIRYVKGKSNMSLPHVCAMRSVVWDMRKNVPVSVTPVKSMIGMSVPESATTEGYSVEQFLDGVMIGMFWDTYTASWRIHTRSSLDAKCKYFSTRSFAELFTEAVGGSIETFAAEFDKNASYTFVLQHPENRIVSPVAAPNAHLVQKAHIEPDLFVRLDHTVTTDSLRFIEMGASWAQIMEKLLHMKTYNIQGVVIKDLATSKRWKLRTPEYTYIRHLRGNNARRDFLHLQLWESGRLSEYLTYYPEERAMVDNILARWNIITSDVFRCYTDVFKAHSMPKTAIPAKYKSFVHGLHQIYLTTHRSIDWRTTVDFMNRQDTAQKLYTINWELRAKAKDMGVPFVHREDTTS
jgi:hypothetical protein